MTVKEFLEEKQIPEDFVEETEDKLIIKHSTCRIILYKKMLESNMLAGNVELHLCTKDTNNDFCTDIENKIDVGNLLLVFDRKSYTKADFPPEVIGNLLDWKAYDISTDPFDGPITYAVVGSEHDLDVFNDKDSFQKIEKGVYAILR